MQEDLNQFERNNICELVSKVSVNQVIGTRWIFHNTIDEDRDVWRNKMIIFAKGYNQQEGLIKMILIIV